MRALTLISAVLATFLVTSTPASAETCATLKPRRFAKLTARQQERLSGGEYWESRTASWKLVSVEVRLDRAPHIVTEILKECPGIKVEQAWPADVRRLTTSVRITVTSYAALTRLAQLPAVKSIMPRVLNKHRFHEIDDFEF